MSRIVRTAFALILSCAAGVGVKADPISHRDILRESDEARGNLAGVTWTVEIIAREGGTTNTRMLDVKARGFDVLAKTMSPPRRRGDTLIMVDGNMWFHQPDLSKPVPISRRQKLMGKAANGDIASTNYANDYLIDAVSSGEHDGEECYVFELSAKTSASTYSKIRYWVSKSRLVGVKAEYYTATGRKLIKSAFMQFDNTVMTGSRSRPFISRMMITDQLTSKDTTILEFSRPHFTPVPADTFNLNLLAR